MTSPLLPPPLTPVSKEISEKKIMVLNFMLYYQFCSNDEERDKKISKYETQPTQLVSAVKLYTKTGLKLTNKTPG